MAKPILDRNREGQDYHAQLVKALKDLQNARDHAKRSSGNPARLSACKRLAYELAMMLPEEKVLEAIELARIPEGMKFSAMKAHLGVERPDYSFDIEFK